MGKKSRAKADPKPLRLDLGCGTRKREGFTGVDIRDFKGVDVVADLTKKWPWPNGSVAEVNCSHTVEHLEWPERVHFFNELGRVLLPGATAQITTPHWSHACYYGDPTHKAPLSEWYAFYLNKEWRDREAPHAPYTCNFDWVFGGSWDPWLETRNQEFRMFAMNRHVNSWRDLIVTLTKRS
jgi:SAM-dependent methyltransferase